MITFIAAFLLNFFLPRMMPGDPVAAIVARMAQGQSNATGVQAIYKQYTELFGTNKPMLTQFCNLYKKCSPRRFWFLVQPISQNGGKRSKIFPLVDGGIAVPGDHRRLSDREYIRRVSGLSQGGV